jgi:uncharacterized protein (DUF1697 family)
VPKYIAFLRAINVGGHTVKMERMRALFEELGFKNVETFIASGQVIFETRAGDTAKLETRIEKHLRSALGYDVASFIRTPAELAAIAGQVDPGEHTLYVCFTRKAPPQAARMQLQTHCNDVDDFEVHDREVYWLCRASSSESNFSGAMLEKILGGPATARNLNTVTRLAAKYAESPPDHV